MSHRTYKPVPSQGVLAAGLLLSCALVFTYAGAFPRWGARTLFSPNQTSFFESLVSGGSSARFRQTLREKDSLIYASFPPSIAQAALETGISPALLLSSVVVLGSCNPIDCYVRSPLFEDGQKTHALPLPVLGFARALSSATNAASSDREDTIGLEALFLGAAQIRSAIAAARQSGSHSPEFFPQHQHLLAKASSQQSIDIIEKIMSLNRLRTLKWPLETERGITSGFGPRKHPIKGQNHFHNGIDLRASHGAEVNAIHSGIVTAAEQNRFNGKFVRVDHGLGLESLYCHLSELTVRQGDYVEEFQTIGKVGQTGQVTGPHLHYTLKIDGIAVNPLHYGFSIEPPSPHLPIVHPKKLQLKADLPPNS